MPIAVATGAGRRATASQPADARPGEPQHPRQEAPGIDDEAASVRAAWFDPLQRRTCAAERSADDHAQRARCRRAAHAATVAGLTGLWLRGRGFVQVYQSAHEESISQPWPDDPQMRSRPCRQFPSPASLPDRDSYGLCMFRAGMPACLKMRLNFPRGCPAIPWPSLSSLSSRRSLMFSPYVPVGRGSWASSAGLGRTAINRWSSGLRCRPQPRC